MVLDKGENTTTARVRYRIVTICSCNGIPYWKEVIASSVADYDNNSNIDPVIQLIDMLTDNNNKIKNIKNGYLISIFLLLFLD